MDRLNSYALLRSLLGSRFLVLARRARNSGRQNWRKSPFLNNFFEIMKKRHNSAPWAPDEASPYLNESSRRAESESEEHFAREAHFSAHFSVNKCYFSVKKKIAKLGRNQVSAQYLGSAWRQDQDESLKIQECRTKKTNCLGLSVR